MTSSVIYLEGGSLALVVLHRTNTPRSRLTTGAFLMSSPGRAAAPLTRDPLPARVGTAALPAGRFKAYCGRFCAP